MKKKYLGFIIAAIMLIAAAFTAIGCTGGEKADYTVTVYTADLDPVSGITVSWCVSSSVKGSATTDAEGKATATLTAGTYEIKLDGIDEGLAYTSVSVTAQMRNVIIKLETAQVTYTATVIDKDGAPAQNVTVNWLDGMTSKGSAVTNGSGVAEKLLDYGEYSVTISNLPAGNIFSGALTATANSPDVRFELNGGETVEYSITVKSEGGLLFKNQSTAVFKDGAPYGYGATDENGVYKFNAPASSYTATTVLPDGYTVTPAQLTSTSREATIVGHSEVIKTAPPSDLTYVIGDIIHDYRFETPYTAEGSTEPYFSSTISEILEDKEAILINNWGLECSNCLYEMPALMEAYETYGDRIEVLAVSNYVPADTDRDLIEFREQYECPFPVMRDANGFRNKFGLTGWPTTIVIDRYGAIARVEKGAVVDAEIWGRLIERYIGDDYVQTFNPGDKISESITTEISKPDITVPDDHYETIAEKINNTSEFPDGASVVWRGEEEYEYAWPFLVDVVDGVSENGEYVLYSSNAFKPNSMSVIYATVNVTAGKVFTFDYYADTEEDYDILSIVWDGKIVKKISGKSNGWQTCYLYVDLTSGEHSLAMTYIKDPAKDAIKDNVYFRNVRFTEIDDIPSADMMRGAAYGVPADGALEYPYYATVELDQTDGYYHVVTSSLENPEYAGTDEHPMLFANLLNVTNFSSLSIREFVLGQDAETLEPILDLTDEFRARMTEYFKTALSSDISGYVPVDEELQGLLVELIGKIGGTSGRSDEWLEICYFYSHYGTGDPIGNPILGLTEKTAIPIGTGTTEADLTRIQMIPFPITIYSFTPSESAVYQIQSLLAENSKSATQIWLYDDKTSSTHPLEYCGDNNLTRDGKNEHNFMVYHYLEAGHTYYLAVAFQMQEAGTFDFSVTKVGYSVTILAPASGTTFTFDVDDDGNITSEVILEGAVEYGVDAEGYYRVKNADGTLGSYIYLDVKYPSTLSSFSYIDLADQFMFDPYEGEKGEYLDYNVFDFTYRFAYYYDDEEEQYTYDPKFNLAESNLSEELAKNDLTREFKDYTQFIKDYIADEEHIDANAPEGLVKINQELVDFLTLYIETRINGFEDNTYELALDNEWLRCNCWYYKTIDANA